MEDKILEYVELHTRIGERAVRKAREENRRLGIPNTTSKKGKLYWEMPDGTITTENPFKKKTPKSTGSSK